MIRPPLDLRRIDGGAPGAGAGLLLRTGEPVGTDAAVLDGVGNTGLPVEGEILLEPAPQGVEVERRIALGEAMGGAKLGVLVESDPLDAYARAQAVIDFTAPAATIGHLQLCRAHGKRMVIGMTILR